MSDFAVSGPHRRPKGMYVMQTPSPDGYKTRAARLIGDGLNCRYSRQAGGYVVSPSKLARFVKLFIDGWDASVVTGELYRPEGDQ